MPNTNAHRQTQLIVFDCDGVLIDSEIIACAADAEALSAIGYSITTEEVISRFAGVPASAMLAEIESDLGYALPEEFSTKVQRQVVARYQQELKAIPGVAEAVTNLPTRYCVASSSVPAKLELGLKLTGLYDLFQPNIFSASQVKNGKPSPDLFIYAAGRMDVDPVHCVVIEDSVAGVMGAVAAGMAVIGFVGGSHCPAGHADVLRQSGATLILDDFSELLTTIGRLDAALPVTA